MIFMIVVTVVALLTMIFQNFAKGNYLLGVMSLVLLVLAGFVINEGMKAINKFKTMSAKVE